MHEHFEAWLERMNDRMSALAAVPLSDDETRKPSAVAAAELDLLDTDDEEDGDDDGDDDRSPAPSVACGTTGRYIEDTERVAAAFRAAGNPRFADVRLKRAAVGNFVIPTSRESAVRLARRVGQSADW